MLQLPDHWVQFFDRIVDTRYYVDHRLFMVRVKKNIRESCTQCRLNDSSIHVRLYTKHCIMHTVQMYYVAGNVYSHIACLFREYKEALVRLSKVCRGIGDPLVALYARCYLCRVSQLTSLLPSSLPYGSN